MTAEDLIAEGKRLARPCVHLRPDGEPGQLAAVWGGPGQVPAPSPPPPPTIPPGNHNRQPLIPKYRHWLTVECRFLPPHVRPRSGIFSVYTESWDRHGVAVHDPLMSLETSCEERRLYAHAVPSLPPLEAVFLYGSSAVREWLGQVGWQADWGMNDNFPAKEITNAYAQAWSEFEDVPVYGERAFAVLGGWHFPWPDGDWLELVDHPLVVMTLAESEPWVEVFDMGDSIQVIQRVS